MLYGVNVSSLETIKGSTVALFYNIQCSLALTSNKWKWSFKFGYINYWFKVHSLKDTWKSYHGAYIKLFCNIYRQNHIGDQKILFSFSAFLKFYASVHSSQALYFWLTILISPKLMLNSSKNGKWIVSSSFQKFSRLGLNLSI